MPPSCPLLSDGSDVGDVAQSSSSDDKTFRSRGYKASTSEDSTSKCLYTEEVNRSPEYHQRKLQSESSEGGVEDTSATSQSNYKDLLSSCSESSLEAGEVESGLEASERWLWRSVGKEEEEGEEGEEEENEGCYTPRATECQIPQLHFCPPAPRKRKPCLMLPFTRQLSGLLVVPDFDAFFPLPKISVRD